MFPDARESTVDRAIVKDAAWAKEKGYDPKNLVSTNKQSFLHEQLLNSHVSLN